MTSMRRPLVLAIDTSTEVLAVALAAADGSVVGIDLPGGARASLQLLPQVHALLADAGATVADLAAVGFGRGPGAFTGLRVSCSVAQGLALGLGCPVLPIDSLLLVAEDARHQLGDRVADVEIAVAMDARMDALYAARYRWCAGSWRVVLEPALLDLSSWHRTHAVAPPPWLAGSAAAAFGARLKLPATVQTLATERSRAAALGRLAATAFERGDGVDAAAALPTYLRDKVAATTEERAAASAAAAAAIPAG